jgi:glucose 1-dehydrogenase
LAFLAGLADQGSNANEPRETTFPNRRNAMPFNNKGILITGGAQGIGLGIARAFLKAGARVALIDCNVEAGRAAEQKLAPLGDAFFIEADIAEEAAVKRAVASTLKRFGRLDVLINNAGIQIEGPSHESTTEDFEKVIGINLKGAYLCSREAIQHFLSRDGGGVIVNDSSVHEIIPKPSYLSYSISKGGMENLTKTLALEYAGRGIRVNAVGPGAIVTPINRSWIDEPQRRAEVESHIPMGRAGNPEEIAAAFAFLASDDASYITGQTLFACGGLTLYPEFRLNWSS